ncbi:MAG: M48 family metalloprotease [Rickettsiales bacterium]|nr:M48 family metalloprotease [Rickettsiales bacterium]
MVRNFLLSIVLFFSSFAFAGNNNIQIISDAEIENNLKSFMEPLVRAAKLNPKKINIHIVADPTLNAFVTNGTEMFINSGLIIKFAYDPNVLYGVMAHEIAHIYAGHLVRMRGDYENMSKIAMGGAALGLALALAGAPEAGTTMSLGTMQAAERGMLSYSREHETEADKIAIDLLYKTHNNGEGLIEFFQYMNQRERSISPDPYARTHPLNNDRIASINNSIKSKLGKFGDNITPDIRFKFKRMAVKLNAFLSSPSEVINKYKHNKYGLSIGYFRLGKFKEAINLLDQVIKLEPNDPYLWELKGQFYFENGKFDDAVKYYQKALNALPNDNLIRIETATAKINLAKGPKDYQLLNSSTKLLKQVLIDKPRDLAAHFMLSRAYGELGDKTKAISALADYYFYQGAYQKSQTLANKVIKMSSPTSREYIRASDIIEYTKNIQ